MRRVALLAAASLCAMALLAPPATATHEPLPPAPNLNGQDIPCSLLPLWDSTFCIAGWTIDTADPWVDWTVAVAGWTIDEANHQIDFVRCDVVGGPACGSLTILEALKRIISELVNEPISAT